jgi:hypothetical protein
MPFLEAIKLAISAILGHKLRSFLTLLGVIFGVATVIDGHVEMVIDLTDTAKHVYDNLNLRKTLTTEARRLHREPQRLVFPTDFLSQVKLRPCHDTADHPAEAGCE